MLLMHATVAEFLVKPAGSLAGSDTGSFCVVSHRNERTT